MQTPITKGKPTMEKVLHLKKGQHLFFRHYDEAVRGEVLGFEVYPKVDSKPELWVKQPNIPVCVWRIVLELKEDMLPVFSKGQTVCVSPNNVIKIAP
jgi:hypothetical protein